MNNQLATTQPLTKKLVAAYFRKLVIDHDITIDEQKLSQKIEITFDDCKKIPAGEFVAKCEKLRFTNLYGKLPKSADFLGYVNLDAVSSAKFEALTLFINNLIGHTLIESISVSASNKAVLKFKSKTEFDKFISLEENLKNEAKEKITKELSTNGFEPKY